MALHFMGAEIPVPSQGLPIGLGGWGQWGEGAEIRQGPLSFIPAPDKGPPAPSPSPSRAPCCCPSDRGCPRAPQAPTPHRGLPVLPQAHYRLQTAEDELESGPASLLCQNPTFQCQGQTGQTMGSSLP